VTQGSADLGLIPLTEGDAPAASTSDEVSGFIEFVKEVLKDEVSDAGLRATHRKRGMPGCARTRNGQTAREAAGSLWAWRDGGTARVGDQPRHDLVQKLAGLAADADLREDSARLLLDEARIADGELPADPRGFAARLGRIWTKALA
jgi:molecular chaperone HtpG